MGAFDTLVALNVNEHKEDKDGLSYLSWSWAWDAVKRLYPEASYTIWKSDKGLPYVYDDLTGFMVYTSVTIEGVTHEMWLPVMDSKNKAMKAVPYQYEGKEWQNGKKVSVMKTVQPATMFDINKTIMRCLVKNLAMFGLGLYIYAGEDLPQIDESDHETAEAPKVEEKPKTKAKAKPKEEPKADPEEVEIPIDPLEDARLRSQVIGYLTRHQMPKEDIDKLCKHYKVNSPTELTAENCKNYIAIVTAKGGNINE